MKYFIQQESQPHIMYKVQGFSQWLPPWPFLSEFLILSHVVVLSWLDGGLDQSLPRHVGDGVQASSHRLVPRHLIVDRDGLDSIMGLLAAKGTLTTSVSTLWAIISWVQWVPLSSNSLILWKILIKCDQRNNNFFLQLGSCKEAVRLLLGSC